MAVLSLLALEPDDASGLAVRLARRQPAAAWPKRCIKLSRLRERRLAIGRDGGRHEVTEAGLVGLMAALWSALSAPLAVRDPLHLLLEHCLADEPDRVVPVVKALARQTRADYEAAEHRARLARRNNGRAAEFRGEMRRIVAEDQALLCRQRAQRYLGIQHSIGVWPPVVTFPRRRSSPPTPEPDGVDRSAVQDPSALAGRFRMR